MSSQQQQWARALFGKSVLKQDKFRQIKALLGSTQDKACLDIGADNGIISLLLREQGGQWSSADLEPRAVQSISDLVGERVFQISGQATPFEPASFDLVVIVDFLEHIEDDRAFVAELRRILKPGGQVIINVPRLVRGSLLRRLRNALGLTDQWHGHLRPGYSLEGLRALLGPDFQVLASRPYSRSFSELIDTALNFGYLLMQRKQKKAGAGAKGTVITQDDLAGFQREFKLLRTAYPALWLLARLDKLLFWQKGYKLILKARLT